ncbi:MAG TPA: hypothetical protein VFE35_04930 [Candidatus Cybelea sp.]|jgi:hypothetical protein|nr:hypothetical protein [Candidatus Cybelea sp.]
MPKLFLFGIALISTAVSVSGCSGGGATPSAGLSSTSTAAVRELLSPAFKKPALVAFDTQKGTLEYWPISPSGGTNPSTISGPLGIFQGYNMVANGNTVAIANYSPAEVVTYNVKTKVENTLPDPYGSPVDIAIDKKATLYALNLASVAVYKAGSSQPTELTCSYIYDAFAIAVDNEGDVFVNGYGPGGFMGVVEYPGGSKPCIKPHLRAELGYAAGIGVNPRNDDLIVVDNPNLCAGGFEGRMVIYPKPYEQRTSRRRNLNATYCAGTFRLDATSSNIFVSDSSVSAGYPIIDQRSYPAAHDEGTYTGGLSGSGDAFGGFTTIPNTLPN